LAAPARLLLKRNQPASFDGFSIVDQVGIGRAGALDDSYPGQKIDPAA
jgi:hypothetical protein